MKQEYLVKALETLEEETQKNEVFKAVHKIMEPYLYSVDDTKLQPIAEGKKTYSRAVEEMRKVALKHKTGNVGVVPPDEAEKLIKQYFGIDSEKTEASVSNKQTVSIFDL